jgi:hypothetical protein
VTVRLPRDLVLQGVQIHDRTVRTSAKFGYLRVAEADVHPRSDWDQMQVSLRSGTGTFDLALVSVAPRR